jgi:branched-chain amino acid aminotransferase
MDGRLVPYDEAKIHIMTPAIRYGAIAFEGIRGYWHEGEEQLYLFRAPEHVERLLQSGRLMGMEDPKETAAQILDLIAELARANGVREDIHIRPYLFLSGAGSMTARGPVSLGAVLVTGASIIPKEPRPFRLTVSSWRRIEDNALSPRIKCVANYQAGRIALLQAKDDGYDGALLLDRDGHVTEEPRACFFMVRRGVAVTPPVTSDILESITRETVIGLFREQHDVVVEERVIDRTELYVADEMFLCGTGMEITAVQAVDRFEARGGCPGPLTQAIQTSYHGMVRGESDLHPEWRTAVY